MAESVDWFGRPRSRGEPIRVALVRVAAWLLALLAYVLLAPQVLNEDLARLLAPSPRRLFHAAEVLGFDVLRAGLYTGGRAVGGFGVGSLLGFAVALLGFRWSYVRVFAMALTEAVRPLPPVALSVVVVLAFGDRWFGHILFIGFGCFMILLVEADAVLNRMSPSILRAGRSLGAAGVGLLWRVLLPSVVPQLIGALRVALALAFAVTISAEFLGVQHGIGSMILAAKPILDTASIYVLLFALVLVAKACDLLLVRTLSRYSHS